MPEGSYAILGAYAKYINSPVMVSCLVDIHIVVFNIWYVDINHNHL